MPDKDGVYSKPAAPLGLVLGTGAIVVRSVVYRVCVVCVVVMLCVV